MQPDYLIVGSGLSSLAFGALMAKAGKRVTVLEAHYLAGGYGHTFSYQHADDVYRFNAQFHYVWNCGPEETVEGYEKVEYVKGVENATEASKNILRWLVKHEYSEEDISKALGGNILRVLGEVW